MRQNVATALQVAGIACGVAGGMLISLVVGLFLACVGLLSLGIALERALQRARRAG